MLFLFLLLIPIAIVFAFQLLQISQPILISEESIQIDCSTDIVFDVLTKTKYILKISPSVSNVSIKNDYVLKEKDIYHRIFYSHNIPNRQKVKIEKIERNSLIITSTNLLGYKITYIHSLTIISDKRTEISIKKIVTGKGIQKLLVKHLLLAEEHEGGYINRIKFETEKIANRVDGSALTN